MDLQGVKGFNLSKKLVFGAPGASCGIFFDGLVVRKWRVWYSIQGTTQDESLSSDSLSTMSHLNQTFIIIKPQ